MICSNELSANDVQPLKSYRYSNPHKTAGIWGEEMSELHRMTFSEQICTTRDRLKFVAGFHSCRHVSLKTPVYMYIGTTYVCAMYVSMKL